VGICTLDKLSLGLAAILSIPWLVWRFSLNWSEVILMAIAFGYGIIASLSLYSYFKGADE
jgi:hypothetical protein